MSVIIQLKYLQFQARMQASSYVEYRAGFQDAVGVHWNFHGECCIRFNQIMININILL